MGPLPATLSLVARALVAAACLVGLRYSLTLARAASLFQKSTPASASAAVGLVPYNPRYLIGLAALQPEGSSALLHRATALNDFDAHSWIQLGLGAEFQQGDLVLAERYYRHATKVNHMFYPAANLANFYFRYQRREDFLDSVRQALKMGGTTGANAFIPMIWSLSDDPKFNEGLMPSDVPIVLGYVDFLLQTNRLDFAESPLMRLLKLLDVQRVPDQIPFTPYLEQPGIRNFLGGSVDRLLAGNRYQAAERIWGALHKYGWLESSVAPTSSPLRNGDFRFTAFQHGFDWAFLSQSGVTTDQPPGTSRLRIRFNAKQPEACRLLQQYVILEPNRLYRLTWAARSDDIAQNSGLEWRLLPVSYSGPNDTVGVVSPDIIGPRETGVWEFAASSQSLNLLILEYVRRLGTVRPEGELSLSAVSLSPLSLP